MSRRKRRRRVTPEDDYVRLAERLWNYSAGSIKDEDTFDRAYDSYMGEFAGKNKELKKKVFKKLTESHTDVLRTRGTKKRELTRREQVELKQKKYNYDYPAYSKFRVVYARKTSVTIRGKKRVVYRDRNGRYARVKE